MRSPLALHTIIHSIPEDGTLVARKYRHAGTEGVMHAIDVILGDAKYLFLSVEHRLSCFYHCGDSYAFDAESLIRGGAILRMHDICWSDEWFAMEKKVDPCEYRATQVAKFRRDVERKGADDLLDAVVRKASRITLSGDRAIRFLRTPKRWLRISGCYVSDTYPEVLVPRSLSLCDGGLILRRDLLRGRQIA
ncbi:MAG: hypothetical protein E6K18_07985 [Methanobacteriota archaeon]|nr:MAG: hypothetical protein E6K18_07985 [Euryarchaeota archaeon]